MMIKLLHNREAMTTKALDSGAKMVELAIALRLRKRGLAISLYQKYQLLGLALAVQHKVHPGP